MSHSGGAMKLMMVMMAMALLTTSHGIGIHINTSVITTSGYSASRCNGLTDTACRIAHSELNFDLEFMLDSEFRARILQGGQPISYKGLGTGPVSCGPADVDKSEYCKGLRNKKPPGCNNDPTNRDCHHTG